MINNLFDKYKYIYDQKIMKTKYLMMFSTLESFIMWLKINKDEGNEIRLVRTEWENRFQLDFKKCIGNNGISLDSDTTDVFVEFHKIAKLENYINKLAILGLI